MKKPVNYIVTQAICSYTRSLDWIGLDRPVKFQVGLSRGRKLSNTPEREGERKLAPGRKSCSIVGLQHGPAVAPARSWRKRLGVQHTMSRHIVTRFKAVLERTPSIMNSILFVVAARTLVFNRIERPSLQGLVGLLSPFIAKSYPFKGML